MRFVIAESFDKSEINRCFDADISCRIGGLVKTSSGKIYRVQDVVFHAGSSPSSLNVRALLKRER